jgi:hypothetical protein
LTCKSSPVRVMLTATSDGTVQLGTSISSTVCGSEE